VFWSLKIPAVGLALGLGAAPVAFAQVGPSAPAADVVVIPVTTILIVLLVVVVILAVD
jgi:hypothetical protein